MQVSIFKALKELCKESNKESRIGWELSDEQVKQIRKNICRRLAILFVLAVVIVIVAYFGIQRYYESSAKAEMGRQENTMQNTSTSEINRFIIFSLKFFVEF